MFVTLGSSVTRPLSLEQVKLCRSRERQWPLIHGDLLLVSPSCRPSSLFVKGEVHANPVGFQQYVSKGVTYISFCRPFLLKCSVSTKPTWHIVRMWCAFCCFPSVSEHLVFPRFVPYLSSEALSLAHRRLCLADYSKVERDLRAACLPHWV